MVIRGIRLWFQSWCRLVSHPVFQAGVTSTIECVCVLRGGCNYMCICNGLGQLGLVISAAFVILVSVGGSYRDTGVLPRDLCYRGCQRYTAAFIIYTTIVEMMRKRGEKLNEKKTTKKHQAMVELSCFLTHTDV